MITHNSQTYFETQSSALQYVEDQLKSKFLIVYPDRIWSEHVNYGTSVSYHLPLNTLEGKPTRRFVHITLYRMDSGRYELNYYKS